MPPTHQRFKDLKELRISSGPRLSKLSELSELSVPGSLDPYIAGCLAPLLPCSLAAWLPRSLVPWTAGSLFPGGLAPWLPGFPRENSHNPGPGDQKRTGPKPQSFLIPPPRRAGFSEPSLVES